MLSHSEDFYRIFVELWSVAVKCRNSNDCYNSYVLVKAGQSQIDWWVIDHVAGKLRSPAIRSGSFMRPELHTVIPIRHIFRERSMG